MPQRLNETVQGHDIRRTPELGVPSFPRVQDSLELMLAAPCSGNLLKRIPLGRSNKDVSAAPRPILRCCEDQVDHWGVSRKDSFGQVHRSG